MYGIVVMAALATGGEVTDFGFHNRNCGGCYGCYGYGCYSASYAGHGAWCPSPYYRSYSSCYGSCYNTCYSSCYGSCYSSGYGYGCCSGYGCISTGPYTNWSCWGCYGCFGTTPYVPMTPETGAPVGPGMPPATGSLPGPQSAPDATRARIVVEVPADAKLYIDDQLMKATDAKRVFNTPALEKGQKYYYEIKVEVAREGVTHTQTRKIILEPGKEVSTSFSETEIVKASNGQPTASR
jgi:uncharacterized protein (TIGR03000 family)